MSSEQSDFVHFVVLGWISLKVYDTLEFLLLIVGSSVDIVDWGFE